MGRNKKYLSGSKTRSFLFSIDLLEKLEEATKLLNCDLTSVVLEILEDNIAQYLQHAKRVSQLVQYEIVDNVKKDEEVNKLFEKYKDSKSVELPLDAGLDRSQEMLLLDALRAHKRLKDHKDEKLKFDALVTLRLMADEAVKRGIVSKGSEKEVKKHFERLVALAETPGMLTLYQYNGDYCLEYEESLRKMVSSPIEQDNGAIESLRILLSRKVLIEFEFPPIIVTVRCKLRPKDAA